MRPKRLFRFGCSKGFEPSCYIEHEKIEMSKYPTFQNVLEKGSATVLDLTKLQLETEKIVSLLGCRMHNISSLLRGKPMEMPIFKALSSCKESLESNIYPNGLQNTTDTPGSESNITEKPNNNTKELIVKTNPEKPLTLIIAQNRPLTRRGSSVAMVSSKRKASDIATNNNKRRKVNNSDTSLDRSNNDIVDTKSHNYAIPNKFWELMEPYCAEINEDHLKFLENMIKSYENDGRFYEIPDVAESIASNCTLLNDDGLFLPSSGAIRDEVKSHLNGFVENKSASGIDMGNLLKKIDSEIRKPLSETKALKSFPKKLVNKLCQETDEMISAHIDAIDNPKNFSNNSTNFLSVESAQPSQYLAKQLKISNSYKLEKQVKKSMDELGMCNLNLPFLSNNNVHNNPSHESAPALNGHDGIAKSMEADVIDPLILTVNDFVELDLPQTTTTTTKSQRRKINISVKEDKALLGLHRRQSELKLVSESNLGMLRLLLVAAKRDMKRQEIERRLAVADADVIECYNIIESYRPIHRQPLKKDRDAAFKALRERQKILKELEAFDSEFL